MIEGRWLKRAGQYMWRVIGIHVNDQFANKKRDHCRILCADLIGLALREKADIITRDWNQAGGYIEECVCHAVVYHER